jgi:adenylate kinase family enzyme
VLGGPASGKTTFAREFAALHRVPHIELDRLFWQANWTPRDDDELRGELAALLQQRRWIVEGQYPVAVQDFIDKADCVVWLDPPLRITWLRLLRRTLRRLVFREELWAGNRENLISVIGPRSILWYALKVRAGQRAANEDVFERLAASGTQLVRLSTGNARNLARMVGSAPDCH